MLISYRREDSAGHAGRLAIAGDSAELAAALSTTVGVIYNLHHRANQLLRECLQRGVE